MRGPYDNPLNDGVRANQRHADVTSGQVRETRVLEALQQDIEGVNSMLCTAAERLMGLSHRLLGTAPMDVLPSERKEPDTNCETGELGASLASSRAWCERLHDAISRLEAL